MGFPPQNMISSILCTISHLPSWKNSCKKTAVLFKPFSNPRMLSISKRSCDRLQCLLLIIIPFSWRVYVFRRFAAYFPSAISVRLNIWILQLFVSERLFDESCAWDIVFRSSTSFRGERFHRIEWMKSIRMHSLEFGIVLLVRPTLFIIPRHQS